MNGADLPGLLPDMPPRLWKFALRTTGDRHDAEDLVQRACVRALERPHQLQPGTSALSWMFSIVHTTWINELRARSVRSRTSIDWDDVLLETVADPAARTPETDVMHGQIVAANNGCSHPHYPDITSAMDITSAIARCHAVKPTLAQDIADIEARYPEAHHAPASPRPPGARPVSAGAAGSVGRRPRSYRLHDWPV